MSAEIKRLVNRAKRILRNNWVGNYTKPSSLLYPHQWSWDSAFIAIGYSSYNQGRAQTELRTLFQGQWKNGMIPHIVYTSEAKKGYFPDAGFWDASRSENAPKDVFTSGITQPPVHSTAVRCLYDRAEDKLEAKRFLEEIYPKLLASHRFFYHERDPQSEGLIYIRHPWESGVDNSPTWDIPLKRIRLDDATTFEREDLKKGIPRDQRPRDWDYNRYIYLVELFKEHNYSEAEILDECPFLVQDTLVNSILVKANQDLLKICEILDQDTFEVKEWEEKTRKAINKKLWHKGHRFYDDHDLSTDKMIEVDTASGFCPLYAGAASKSQAQSLLDYLDSASFCSMHQQKCYSIPNYNMEGEHFEPSNYWRGPIWININWMLYNGLRRYGFTAKADSVKEDIIELIRRFGFYEYYDPLKGVGYGSKDFSWTAALFLDLIYEEI
jgi:glycogen debranching enzyme